MPEPPASQPPALSGSLGLRAALILGLLGLLAMILPGLVLYQAGSAAHNPAPGLALGLSGLILLLLAGLVLLVIRPLLVRLRQLHLLLETSAQHTQTLSQQDGLTGLANRRHLDQRLADECRRAARAGHGLALVLLDLDQFKNYNDVLGHQAGDLALTQVAGALAWSARRAGDLAARYGGDQLALLLPDTPPDGAVAVAHLLRAQVEKLAIPFPESAQAARLSICLGLACRPPQPGAPGPLSDPSLLLEAAERSLRQAKQAGPNQVGPCLEAA